MALKVGIDLGTTFSAVAMIDPVTGRPVIIPNSSGEYVTPSVLCFKQNDESDDEEDNIEILFGSPAKQEQAEGNPNSVAFFKRCMGNDNYEVEIFDEAYNAEDMSAVFLKCLKDDAETVLGEEITDAVITVPAYFAHKERTATLSAGKRAGLNVLSIINEPSAAAFAYGLTEKEQPQTVLIYDLGGGTFDVTAARIDKKQINILGSDGDHELGGKDWDDAVAKYIASEFEDITGEDLTLDGQAVAMLLVIAENIKKELSTADRAVVSLNYGEEEVSIEITYDTFREVTEFLTRKTKDVTERMLESVNLTWDEFDGVILVGGSTRMRMIREFVTQMSSKKPLDGVNVDDAVSLGAAIRANINDDGKFAYERGEEVVRVQGAKAISDVTAHSLGMIAQSADGERYENSVIIEKNTKIPAEATRPFKIKTRAAEYGTNELEIYLTQGEFERPLDNVIINKYVVKGIEYVDAPESVISVTYKYNSNGVIEVSAVQNETGKHLDIVVRSVPEDMEWTDEKDIFAGPKTGQSSRNGGRPRHMEAILCVDLSGSMAGEPTRVAQEAMRTFCSQVLEDTLPAKIGIVAFADDVEILTTPENNTKILYDKIDMLRYTNVGAGNLADPFEAARAIFLGADAQYIVILTDGVWSDPKRAIAFAKDCKKSGIHVIALGIGDADEKFTDSLSTINIENFSSFTDLANLASSFSKIARAITSDE